MQKRFQPCIAVSFLLFFSLIIFSCSEKETPADLIIRGGTIYTAEDSNPVVEAVAVIGDKIVYAGDLKNSAKFQGKNTQVIDLQGKTMTPGFIEGHGHFFGVGDCIGDGLQQNKTGCTCHTSKQQDKNMADLCCHACHCRNRIKRWHSIQAFRYYGCSPIYHPSTGSIGA